MGHHQLNCQAIFGTTIGQLHAQRRSNEARDSYITAINLDQESGKLINLEVLPAQSLGDARRSMVACVYLYGQCACVYMTFASIYTVFRKKRVNLDLNS